MFLLSLYSMDVPVLKILIIVDYYTLKPVHICTIHTLVHFNIFLKHLWKFCHRYDFSSFVKSLYRLAFLVICSFVEFWARTPVTLQVIQILSLWHLFVKILRWNYNYVCEVSVTKSLDRIFFPFLHKSSQVENLFVSSSVNSNFNCLKITSQNK